MRISYVPQQNPDWYGAIASCARPNLYWAHTDDESIGFETLPEAQRHMKRKKYIPEINELELFPEEARHVARHAMRRVA